MPESSRRAGRSNLDLSKNNKQEGKPLSLPHAADLIPAPAQGKRWRESLNVKISKEKGKCYILQPQNTNGVGAITELERQKEMQNSGIMYKMLLCVLIKSTDTIQLVMEHLPNAIELYSFLRHPASESDKERYP